MKKLLAIFICLLTVLDNTSTIHKLYGQDNLVQIKQENIYPIPGVVVQIESVGYEGEDEDLNNVMVPIPMENRVFNKTGIQCVWCSLETCGRYAEEPKIINLTDLNDCKGYSSPSATAAKLKQLKIKFEQTTNKSDRSLIIKSVVNEKRGCLFAIPGHAMTLVHYDEKIGIVKYINNSDSSLKIHTWTMEEFNRRWDGWICVIYADNDIIPQKNLPALKIPIIDRSVPQALYPKDYILLPKK
jgi:hypothetical protein